MLHAHSKLLFIGDSVTDAGRVKNGDAPSEGLFDPMGRGYVTLIEALLTATYPDRALRVVNVGTSGHTVRDLASRWDRDVLALKPEVLSVCIGINDVWRQFDSPRQPELAVPLAEYERTYDALLARTRPHVKTLVLMTPFFIEPSRQDAMRARMDAYGAVVKTLAAKHDAVFVDTQAAFDRALTHLHSASLAWDRIHPNQAGHMILARAWLTAVGYQW